jgi:RHH-type rel operon transcriptional repressor/antitoxin RelB
MAVTISLRIDDLLEKQIALAAKSQGITRTQFLINAAEMALGKRQPYGLMLALKAQEAEASYKPTQETPYDTEAAREAIVNKLKAKHGVSTG